MEKRIGECPTCHYKWVLRAENPKECSRCKTRLDNWNRKLKIETEKFSNFDDWKALKKELDRWNEEHPSLLK